MNRAQLREQVKQGQLYTPVQVAQMIRSSRKKDLEKLANDYCAVMMWTLRSKYGFGHDRALKFIQNINETFLDIDRGIITIADITEALKDEIDVNIK